MSLLFHKHPSEKDLALFAGGELGPLGRWRIERHLDRCDHCQEMVADFFHLQSELGELAAVPSIDWNLLREQTTARVEQAARSAQKAPPMIFSRPLVWRLGLATATVLCAFVVVRQFPNLPSSIKQGEPIAKMAVEPVSQTRTFAESEPKDLPRQEATADGDVALTAAEPSKPEQSGQEGQLAEQLAELNQRARPPEERPLEKQKKAIGGEFFRANTGLKVSETADLRKSMFADEMAPREQAAQPPDVAAPPPTAQSTEAAVANKNEPRPVGAVVASADDLKKEAAKGAVGPALADVRRRSPQGPANAAREVDLVSAAASELAEGVGARRIPDLETARLRTDAAEPARKIERAEAAPASAGFSQNRLAAVETEEMRRDDKTARSKPDVAPLRGFSVLPAALADPQADVGVAADGWISIRSLDTDTGTITITDVYVP